MKRSLAFRLAAAYALIFAVSSVAGLLVTYFIASTYVMGAADAELEEEFAEITRAYAQGGLPKVRAVMKEEAAEEGVGTTVYRLYSADGASLGCTDSLLWLGTEPSSDDVALAASGRKVYETRWIDSRGVRAKFILGRFGVDLIVQIGWSLEPTDTMLAKIGYACAFTTVAMVLVGMLTGWLMGRRAMAGVGDVTRATASIADGHFERRITTTRRHGEEIDQLVDAFNSMAERVQSVMKEMREVNDNIAHDLRSSIARMRGLAEAVLIGTTTEDHQALGGSVIEECDLLLGMINTMLDISEVEAGVGRFSISEVDLSDLVRRGVEIFLPMAEEKGVALSPREIPGQLPVKGDLARLQHALSNLLDNAIKYSPAGTRVTVSVAAEDLVARISIVDVGGGIPPKELPRIFDRFYRGDTSRSEPGSGLGLSLARAVARAHGGDVTVQSKLGEGSTFTMELPIARPDRL